TLNVEPNKNRKGSIYRKILEYNVNYANNAKLVCIFNGHYASCKNNPLDENTFQLIQPPAKKEDFDSGQKQPINIGVIQKLENVDPIDPKLWYHDSFKSEGGYFMPSFNKEYKIESPIKILSTNTQNQTFAGFG
ncbi:hypothetical protein, partial [Xenorhabdus bharatensis]|uniref:hypothetical protein n=1 Tax=Xenorhabdus bharatensis TaxID=3136256 RepID=UPI0030F4064A